ncbi:amidohydrolase family protein [Brevundimonas sp.]|uniref:amidohydrolase family protein n=1 Tax=Brevundimonas sp. TaxID=1871086 RepID=UPI001A34129E|nr:amidohydrolase family protein [Brevundimonas sp.]MBJ7483159.1 amidohydrolase [Brevundimonas sp.]
MKIEDMIIVSVDDHIVEPPTMYDQHISVQHKGIAPELRKDKNGVEFWLYEGRRTGAIGLNAVVGRVKEEYGCEPVSLQQMRKGAWDIDARIEDMNANGILSSLNFPSVVQFDGFLFHGMQDKANALIILRAYNDWHIDEWCGSYPGRNIPNAILPYWDIDATVEEIRRVAAKGCHNISFSDNPAVKGYPSIHNAHWEPLWKACVENDMCINIHIGSGAQAPHASMESPIDAWITTMPISIVNSAADWLFLKALQKYPLKIALSEGGIGWIPYFLERADFSFQQHNAWTHSDFGPGRKPSDLFREHFLTCFVDDKFGLANIAAIGEDNIAYECDYPHSDTLWPDVPEILHASLNHLTDAQIDKISHGNALKRFNFDAVALLGGREKCTVGALRKLAAHVDTRPQSFGGPAPLAPGEVRRGVTSGDIMKMFMDVAKEDGTTVEPALEPAE